MPLQRSIVIQRCAAAPDDGAPLDRRPVDAPDSSEGFRRVQGCPDTRHAGRRPPGTSTSRRSTRRVIRDGCVVVNQAARTEFQQGIGSSESPFAFERATQGLAAFWSSRRQSRPSLSSSFFPEDRDFHHGRANRASRCRRAVTSARNISPSFRTRSAPSPLRAPRRPPSGAPSSRRASVSHGAARGAFG